MEEQSIELVENIIESTIKEIEGIYMNSQNYNMPKIAHANIEQITILSIQAFDNIQKTIKGERKWQAQ